MVWGFHSLAHRLNVAKWETEKEEKKNKADKVEELRR
jgi:hypothetical protein